MSSPPLVRKPATGRGAGEGAGVDGTGALKREMFPFELLVLATSCACTPTPIKHTRAANSTPRRTHCFVIMLLSPCDLVSYSNHVPAVPIAGNPCCLRPRLP